ncbi:hypothetical protein Hypma_005044 [Hypsizygus marmoreus]|uniref:Uncharacterized protein n=1 Tax=Hypsizygus marmoreus TaxID=39966 RepID=A0A369K069_HYPMA|nr:hypothetical protein Hypma_005044 [Hypsizygus marmoreus]
MTTIISELLLWCPSLCDLIKRTMGTCLRRPCWAGTYISALNADVHYPSATTRRFAATVIVGLRLRRGNYCACHTIPFRRLDDFPGPIFRIMGAPIGALGNGLNHATASLTTLFMFAEMGPDFFDVVPCLL